MSRVRQQKGVRAEFGNILLEHKGRKIFTTVGSRAYEGLFGGLQTQSSPLGIIPSGYAHRPDLIADLFLDSTDLWWVICEKNAIFDVFEQLKSGDSILLNS